MSTNSGSETLIERSSRFIDEGVYEGPAANNPTDATLHEVADGIAVVCAFSHVWNLRTDDGLVVFDTSLAPFGPPAVQAVRRMDRRPVPFDRLHPRSRRPRRGSRRVPRRRRGAGDEPGPTIVAHENAPRRFDRYELTNGYNSVINQRQFGGNLPFPSDFVRPDETFETSSAGRRRRHGDRAQPRSGRDRRPRLGLGARAPGPLHRAICSSGCSRTPATLRRCSGGRPTGRWAFGG